MEFSHVEVKSREELIRRLREVTLKGSGEKVYAASDICVRSVDPRELHPCQYYVLQADLDRVADLSYSLLNHDVDIFELEGFVEFTLKGKDEVITILPPVCEYTRNSLGDRVRIINDGMHRIFLARLEWRYINVVMIDNVPQPYYAYPIPGKFVWEQVHVMRRLHPEFMKRWYRGPKKEAKKLFRLFDAPGAFNTKHVQRGTVKVEHAVTGAASVQIAGFNQ
jgi:hypothetical protein